MLKKVVVFVLALLVLWTVSALAETVGPVDPGSVVTVNFRLPDDLHGAMWMEMNLEYAHDVFELVPTEAIQYDRFNEFQFDGIPGGKVYSPQFTVRSDAADGSYSIRLTIQTANDSNGKEIEGLSVAPCHVKVGAASGSPSQPADSADGKSGSSKELGLEIKQKGSAAEIIKYRGSASTLVIPQWLDGCQVTSIGKEAFKGCEKLTSVTIPGSVSSIGESAFEFCYRLKTVTIPNGVASIGDRAFYSCSDLESVTIPNSVTKLGENPFKECERLSISISGKHPFFRLKDDVLFDKDMKTLICCLAKKEGEYAVPSSVTAIEPGAFSGCKKLTAVKIAKGVTAIRERTFEGCSSLAAVTISGGVHTIGEKAFYQCYNLVSNNKSPLRLPNSLKRIGKSAFANCKSLEDIELPSGVTNIGASAFADCGKLKYVTVPKSVKSIGNDVFLNHIKSFKVRTTKGADVIQYCEEQDPEIDVILTDR